MWFSVYEISQGIKLKIIKMDKLQKELERKRKALALAKNSNDQKYVRAADLRQVEDDLLLGKKRVRSGEKKEEEQEKQDTKKIVKSEKPILGVEKVASSGIPSDTELTRQLRQLGLPIRLFGELDNSTRFKRLEQAREASRSTRAALSEQEEFRLGANTGHNIRNPFLQRKESKEEEQDVAKVSIEPQPSPPPPRREELEHDPHKRVHTFFKGLLKQWEIDLIQRPESVKQTLAGKNDLKTYKQCKDYIRPLFKLLKNRSLEERILAFLIDIVTYSEEGEFVKAHASYMDLAIGRAAWPIGVTMVGIHARSGREKIGSNNVAHVMNSELQRKYLTSVKRLMSYAQTKRPDVDPSKQVR